MCVCACVCVWQSIFGVLQCVAVCCNSLTADLYVSDCLCCSALQCVTVCYSVLQRVVVS